ncbi:MAG: type II toxin-antitoxin system HicA family toxin [Coriobacteriales bacterium]|jgi:predicted RNA binding protein YcfA (HicA-like mRNA interferase family)|nr:type II toxin-antitoxin system HicA family toxin [Coriobacteriales bacterium]
MQPPTVREVIGRLEKEGYRKVNQVGSHRKFSNGARNVTIAGDKGENLKWETWKRIQEQAGW